MDVDAPHRVSLVPPHRADDVESDAAGNAGRVHDDGPGRAGDFKAKLGAIPDSSRTRWVWSRYRWLLAVRGAAGRVYRWQQRLRGLVRAALRPKLVPVVAEEPSAAAPVKTAPVKPAPPSRQRTRETKVKV